MTVMRVPSSLVVLDQGILNEVETLTRPFETMDSLSKCTLRETCLDGLKPNSDGTVSSPNQQQARKAHTVMTATAMSK